MGEAAWEEQSGGPRGESDRLRNGNDPEWAFGSQARMNSESDDGRSTVQAAV